MWKRFAEAFGLFIIALASTLASHSEETLPPLQLSVKLDADLVPHVSLKNISKQDVRIIVANASNARTLNENWDGYVYGVSVQPEPSISFSTNCKLDEKYEQEFRSRMLGPGETHESILTKLCGFLSVRKGEFKITAKYEVGTINVHRLPLAERETLWRGKIVSEPARLNLDRPPLGIGNIENAELWATKHGFKGPLIHMIERKDHSLDTLRLWLHNLAAGDHTIFGASHAAYLDGFPKDWTLIGADIVMPVLFRKTGIGILRAMSTMEKEADKQNEEATPKEALPESHPGLREFGLTEQLEKEIVNHRDFDWIRELDGARIHYRSVYNEYFGLLFEVWEEEYKDSKPEMDQFIKAMLKYHERRESKDK